MLRETAVRSISSAHIHGVGDELALRAAVPSPGLPPLNDHRENVVDNTVRQAVAVWIDLDRGATNGLRDGNGDYHR
ncbi:hypothetical protein JYU34_004282 [Plutella xylostella]|uniref:Uncharacterized protein n=1 Tax=Plutella xylostella TaxID=51655 RepID=A0ABQ7PX12_PLUXY|nr:hypothetical protein JYU34_019534 [Plutella xylostella]KAG7300142.1 hypothetical protein JYU34_015691 [Plutella xylostella]KAG7309782.1 hypothetical protein JYU34_004282 [Plutella xylostella]